MYRQILTDCLWLQHGVEEPAAADEDACSEDRVAHRVRPHAICWGVLSGPFQSGVACDVSRRLRNLPVLAMSGSILTGCLGL